MSRDDERTALVVVLEVVVERGGNVSVRYAGQRRIDATIAKGKNVTLSINPPTRSHSLISSLEERKKVEIKINKERIFPNLIVHD